KRHNLKDITVQIPCNVFTCITGVSGSGKSSLVEEMVLRNSEFVVVDQSAIGSSPRSNPATYLGVFDDIRSLFARASGSSASLFAFNSNGACKKCSGLGYIMV